VDHTHEGQDFTEEAVGGGAAYNIMGQAWGNMGIAYGDGGTATACRTCS